MKFTWNWLRDHLATEKSLEEITQTLTRIGLTVEGVEERARALEGFWVGEVDSVRPHPNADRLRLCRLRMKTGGRAAREIVCGAPNLRPGLRVVAALPGAVLPGGGRIARRMIRGALSQGMICSAAELGLEGGGEKILELGAEAGIGARAAAALGLDDPVIDVEATYNRADWLGVAGIARDLAAAGCGRLRDKKSPALPGGAASAIKVHLDFPRGAEPVCRFFAGRMVRGVENRASPGWLQARLRAAGLRPIDVLVDVTNYIALTYARPLHVYDAAKLEGDLVARLARRGERLAALDGKTYALEETMCVIADRAGAQGLGGVIGGAAAGVGAKTRDVFIESAWFSPARTAATGRALNIVSHARQRFERGVDPQATAAGCDRAARMIADLCGGEISAPVRAGRAGGRRRLIAFDPDSVRRLTGLDVPRRRACAILKKLGCEISGGGRIKVRPPSWRRDLSMEVDLVEEVVRIAGVNEIAPAALPAAGGRVARPDRMRLSSRMGAALAARGLIEAMTWSFIPEEMARLFAQAGRVEELRLANPIAEPLSVMRPGLLPGLLMAVGRNLAAGARDIALFERGPVYAAARPGAQSLHIAGVRQGTAQMSGAGRHWSGAAAPVGVFDAKADALDALAAAGVEAQAVAGGPGAPDWYHPGRSGVLRLGEGKVLGFFGEIHPRILQHLDFAGPAACFELNAEALAGGGGRDRRAAEGLPPARLHPIRRDFAFVVDRRTQAGPVLAAIRRQARGFDPEVILFDLFEGAGLGEGKKSLAVEVVLHPPAGGITEAGIEEVSGRIIAAVEKAAGGVLRRPEAG